MTVCYLHTWSHDFGLTCCQDNGVKVVEPLGEMLVQEWESLATRLANTRSPLGYIV